jgi:exodeoxyribonuclease V gamma subunit
VRYRFASGKAFDRLGLWIRHLAASRAGAAGGASLLLASDGAVSLRPAGDTAALDDLVRWYLEGMRLPLPFFPESSLAFAEAVHSGGSEEEGMRKARQKWQPGEWEPGRAEADEPSIRQCFGSADPLKRRFRELARAVYEPLLASEVRE